MAEILLIGPKEPNIIQLETILGDIYEIKVVEKANDAFPLLSDIELDLIIMDLSEKDAFQLMSTVQERAPYIGLVLIIPERSTNYQIQAFKAGMDDFISLPIIPSIVKAIVYHVISKKSFIKSAEERYRDLFEHVNVALLLTDQDGIIEDVNEEAVNLFGYLRDEMHGMNAVELFESPETIETVLLGISASTSKSGIEEKIMTQSGDSKWVMHRSVKLSTSEPNISGVLIALLDMTEKHRATKELSQTVNRLNAILENTNDLVFIILNDDISFANSAARKLIQSEQVLSLNNAEGIFPEESYKKIKSLAQNAFKTREMKEGEIVLTIKDDQHVYNTRVISSNSSPKDYVIILTDISAIYHTEKELQKKNYEMANIVNRLQEINNFKSRFFRAASHEIKTPLTVIKSSIDILTNAKYKLTDQDRADSYKTIHNNVVHMQNLISNILQVMREEARHQNFDIRKIHLIELAKDVVDTYRPLNPSVTTEITIPTDMTAYGDKEAIFTALANLYTNALKFTEQSSNLLIEAKLIDNWVEVSVEDTGIGIPHDQLEKIFDEFYKLDTHEGGTGLGLYIVKNIVKRHGGTIRVKSTPGRGSRFSFTIPAQKEMLEVLIEMQKDQWEFIP